ncbi:MAG: RsmE family RNA methyltransferase [Pseudomonadota bacterium]
MARPLRVYVAHLEPGRRELAADAAHYVGDVHRLRAGAAFVAFDPEAALEADARVIAVERRRVVCELETPRPATRLGRLNTELLQAVGKGEKLEEVVRAATALGARSITMVAAERSVARPDESRRTRLRGIAIEAARQSGRGDLPALAGPEPLERALTAYAERRMLKLCLDPRAEMPLVTRIADHPVEASAALLVGPEGGLSPAEIELAVASGFERVALGPLTLRTELAAVIALGCFAARLAGDPA